jgi:hypothetical protein
MDLPMTTLHLVWYLVLIFTAAMTPFLILAGAL